MTLSGTGSLWLDGEQVFAALRYAVTVVPHGVMMRTTGKIQIEPWDAGPLIMRLGPNSDLVLRLEDGRSWPCTLGSTDGDLHGRGEIR